MNTASKLPMFRVGFFTECCGSAEFRQIRRIHPSASIVRAALYAVDVGPAINGSQQTESGPEQNIPAASTQCNDVAAATLSVMAR